MSLKGTSKQWNAYKSNASKILINLLLLLRPNSNAYFIAGEKVWRCHLTIITLLLVFHSILTQITLTALFYHSNVDQTCIIHSLFRMKLFRPWNGYTDLLIVQIQLVLTYLIEIMVKLFSIISIANHLRPPPSTFRL